ncbi:hypothetical protein NQ176_g5445 [Zarea fungicola]|uniref:Uncharacterized protein n=1 Tax=Zarea fungicola TaxID=93591 RepID=A0ACC1N9W0_9HYPO|nr:hypothetical protein NQ176_g5445 [Lecanicillium fungicola]
MDFDSKFGDCVKHIENTIRHTFSNKKLCAESLNNAGPTASVYVADRQFTTLPKNDRLAVYGDIVATSMLCRDWYDGGSTAWTAMRNDVLSNEYLAEIGFTLGLDHCINKDAGTTSVSKRMMATAVEALLGAVHLDGGDEALRVVLGQLRIVSPEDRLVLLAKATKWPSCKAAQACGAFDPSDRGALGFKALSAII